MRILSLDLIRYGHFTGGVVDLGDREGLLQIVLARNAKGKTTTLNAIRDLLFGIPRTSPYRFRHPEDPRVAGLIADSSGAIIRMQRRRGTTRSLLDGDGQPLAPDVMHRVLAGVDRDLFESLFGLDHRTLRVGGAELARGQGSVGEALFAAASGLTGLREVAERYNSDASSLLSSQRRSGVVVNLVSELRSAQAEMRDRLREVGADRFRRLAQELQEAETQLDGAREQLHAHTHHQSRVTRVLRTLPIVNELELLRNRIAAFGGVPTEDPAIATEWERARRAFEEIEGRCCEFDQQIADSGARLSELVVNSELLSAADVVADLQRRAGSAEDALTDLPKRLEALSSREAVVRNRCRQLGLSPEPTSALEQVPELAVREEIRSLSRLRREAEGQRAEFSGRFSRIGRRLEETERQRAEIGEPTDLSSLEAHLGDGQLTGLPALLDQAERRAETERTHAENALRGLSHFTGDVERLLSLPAPSREKVEFYREQFRDSAASLRAAAEAERALQTELTQIEREMARYGDREVPTAERITVARTRRDTHWEMIRRVYLDREEPQGDLAERHEAMRQSGGVRVAYEALVSEADRLADGRADHAEQVEKYRELERRLEAVTTDLAAAREGRQRLEVQGRELDAQWSAEWVHAGIVAEQPSVMLSWLAQRETVRRHADEAACALSEVNRLRRTMTERATTLCDLISTVDPRALPTGPGGQAPDLGHALATASAVRQRCAELAVLRARLASELDGLRVEIDDAKAGLGDVERQQVLLQGRWERAMSRIGRSPSTTPDEADALLGALGQLETECTAYLELHCRVDSIQRVIAEFEEEARRIAGLLGGYDSEDAFAVASRLAEDLNRARTVEASRQTLVTTTRLARRRRDELEDARAGAAARIAALRSQLGAQTDRAAEEQVATIVSLVALRGQEDQVRRKLEAAGDGMSLDVLIEEVRGGEIDETRAELAALDSRLEQARQALETASNRRRDLLSERKRLEEDFDTTAASTRVEESRLSLETAATRCAVLRAADLLIRGAIETFRQQSVSTQMARASELFRVLTCRSHECLFIDEDESGGQRLLARDGSGRVRGVEALSDGELDQLYLALRLAAVEDYTGRSEPMPFIADDLLVNFDNDRAAAALEVLSDLARRTQVIFLTHHDHLVGIAGAVLGSGRFTLRTLPEAA